MDRVLGDRSRLTFNEAASDHPVAWVGAVPVAAWVDEAASVVSRVGHSPSWQRRVTVPRQCRRWFHAEAEVAAVEEAEEAAESRCLRA